MLVQPDRYFETERRVDRHGLSVFVGSWKWDGPFEAVFLPLTVHRIGFMLTAAPPQISGRLVLDDCGCDYSEVGDLAFGPVGSELHYKSYGVAQRAVYCDVDPTVFKPAHELLAAEYSAIDLQKCLNLRLSNTRQYMTRIAEELASPSYGTPLLVESLVVAALVDITRHLKEGTRVNFLRHKGLSDWQLRRIDELVRDLSNGIPTLARLAAECGISRAKLAKDFKISTGLSVRGHVSNIRIARAKSLIIETRLPFKSIAYELGFSSPSAFSYAFDKTTGISPGEFRREAFARRNL